MKRQTILMGVAVLVLLSLIGFYAGFLAEQGASQGSEKFRSEVNYTADNKNDIVTAEFDNSSLDIFHEGSREAKFYLDLDRDGSSDIRFEGLQHDGEVHNTTELVDMNNTTYRLYFEYRDSSDETGDAWIRLYKVREL